MKYHCLFLLLLSLFDFDSIQHSLSRRIIIRQPTTAFSRPRVSVLYGQQLLSVWLNQSSTQILPPFFLLPPDLNGCCTYITCRHTCIYIHVRLPFIEKFSSFGSFHRYLGSSASRLFASSSLCNGGEKTQNCGVCVRYVACLTIVSHLTANFSLVRGQTI
jgi:hypothetical protein